MENIFNRFTVTPAYIGAFIHFDDATIELADLVPSESGKFAISTGTVLMSRREILAFIAQLADVVGASTAMCEEANLTTT